MTLLPIPADAAAIALLLGGFLLPQVVLVLWFCVSVRARAREFRGRSAARAAAAVVPAEVVLCLRGCDATLERVLAALAGQSHRRWRLRVVVDSIADPAWAVTKATLARLEAEAAPAWSGCAVEPLAVRPVRGSLKCAALRQALRALDPDTAVIALVDADSVVHRDWLVTMVDECTRPGIGAVSGNRWYDPDADTPAAVVRAIWNAGAIVQMAIFGIPWGGSLAVRREAMDDSGWLGVIESSLCEDTSLAAPLAAAGWRYRYVPALTAVDRDDDIELGPLTRWIARQLLTARLHHPLWPLVAIHGVGTSLALVTAVIGLAAALVSGRLPAAAAIAATLLAYEALNVPLLTAITAAIRTATTADNPVRPLTLGRLCRWVALIPLTQAVYAMATLATLRTRSVEWRGVVYEIRTTTGRAEVVIT